MKGLDLSYMTEMSDEELFEEIVRSSDCQIK